LNVLVQAALANAGYAKSTELLLAFLQENVQEAVFYKQIPRPRVIMNTALDWQMVANVASIATIAGVLWNAYEKLIAPRKDTNRNAFVYVIVLIGKRQLSFNICEEYGDEQTFTNAFLETIHAASMCTNPDDDVDAIRELDESKTWEKVIAPVTTELEEGKN